MKDIHRIDVAAFDQTGDVHETVAELIVIEVADNEQRTIRLGSLFLLHTRRNRFALGEALQAIAVDIGLGAGRSCRGIDTTARFRMHHDRREGLAVKGRLEFERRTIVQIGWLTVAWIDPHFILVELGDDDVADAVTADQIADIDAAAIIAFFKVGRIADTEIGPDLGGQNLQNGQVLDLDHAKHIGKPEHVADIVRKPCNLEIKRRLVGFAAVAAGKRGVGHRVAEAQHVEAANAQLGAELSGFDRARDRIGSGHRESSRPDFVVAEVVGDNTGRVEVAASGDCRVDRQRAEHIGIDLEDMRVAVELPGVRIVDAWNQRIEQTWRAQRARTRCRSKDLCIRVSAEIRIGAGHDAVVDLHEHALETLEIGRAAAEV